MKTRVLPSSDQSLLKMWSEGKLVICFSFKSDNFLFWLNNRRQKCKSDLFFDLNFNLNFKGWKNGRIKYREFCYTFLLQDGALPLLRALLPLIPSIQARFFRQFKVTCSRQRRIIARGAVCGLIFFSILLFLNNRIIAQNYRQKYFWKVWAFTNCGFVL